MADEQPNFQKRLIKCTFSCFFYALSLLLGFYHHILVGLHMKIFASCAIGVVDMEVYCISSTFIPELRLNPFFSSFLRKQILFVALIFSAFLLFEI